MPEAIHELRTAFWRRLRTIVAVVLACVAARAHGQAAEVDVELVSFGLGGVARAGEIAAIRVEVAMAPESALGAAAAAWVAWEVPNDDGDIAEYGRPITLNRNRTTPVWLYAPIPPNADNGSLWTVRVYATEDGVRGRELGGARIGSKGGLAPLDVALLGSIGPSPMGLQGYARPITPTGGEVLLAHENTRTVFGIRADEVPDQWIGLASFEALVWGGAEAPSGIDRIGALREWIRRGGHLVVVLPSDGNPWGLGEPGAFEMDDLLPAQRPRRIENVPMERLLPLLTKSQGFDERRTARPVTVQVFADPTDDFDAIDAPYEPFLALPDGRVVAVRRHYGFGHVTVVGLDLADPVYASVPRMRNGLLAPLPEPDAFWNPVLARRQDSADAGQVRAIEDAKRLGRATPNVTTVGDGPLAQQHINMSGRAGRGLGIGALLFSIYWIVAGPGSYLYLRGRGRVRHAWLAFAGAAGAFTILAWVVSMLLREHEVEVRHLTVLDLRAATSADAPGDGGLARATSWFAVYAPGYGTTPVEISPATLDDGSTPADLLVSWSPPPLGSLQTFPNVDRYPVDLRRTADEFVLPSRSTATRLHARWLGVPTRPWLGGFRPDPNDPVRIERDASGNEVLAGRLLHDLPGPLEQATIIWVRSQRPPRRAYAGSGGVEEPWVLPLDSGAPTILGSAWRLDASTPWTPGTAIAMTPPAGNVRLEALLDQRYVAPFREAAAFATAGGPIPEARRREFLEMLALFRQLPPPAWLQEPEGQAAPQAVLRRTMAREIDLSGWLAQPCVVVMGFVEESPLPFDLQVRNAPAPGAGRTFVRWILPLPTDPSLAFPRPAE